MAGKLTDQQKNRIAQLHNEDGITQSRIADFYGVSQGTISNVLKEKRWEAELAKRDQMMVHAMSLGVEAHLNQKEAERYLLED